MEPLAHDLRLTRRAERQLEQIHRYIARDSLQRADHSILAIALELARLSKFPESGRPGRVKGTRELVISGTPYLAVYRLRNSVVEIASVFHGAQERT